MANDDGLVEHYQTVGLERAKLFSPEKYRERLQDLYAKFK
jgi:hypothetical protein